MGYNSSSVSLVNIFKKINEKTLVLPNFQREYVWDKSQQESLLASFFVKLPIGSFLFLEGPKEEYASKELGKISGIISYNEIESPKVQFLLDGQQRITTLKSIFTDIFYKVSSIEDFKESHKNTYNRINKRWFLKLYSKSDKDFFGFEDLNFDEFTYKHTEPKDIENLFDYELINRAKDEDKWYNPMYKIKENLSDKDYKNEVIKNSIYEERIPLFFMDETKSDTLYENEIPYKNTVFYQVLYSIAKNNHSNKKEYKSREWARDVYDYLKGCLDTELHIIQVPSEEKGRAIPIFEHINSGGTALDTFDLIVAKAADKKGKNYKIYSDDKQSLRDAISEIVKKEIDKSNFTVYKTDDIVKFPDYWTPKFMFFNSKNDMYSEFKTRYLSILSLVGNLNNITDVYNVQTDYLKKSKALDLSSEAINENTYKVINSIIDAVQFLQFRCGVKSINNISYKLMVVPISYIFLNKNDLKYNLEETCNILEVWYWFSLFTGTYRDNKNKRCIEDIQLLYGVIMNNNKNKFIDFINEFKERYFAFEDYSDEITLTENNDVPRAVSRSIVQYVLSKTPNDLLKSEIRLNAWDCASGETKIEEHHIIPLGSDIKEKIKNSKLRNEKNHILNSPLNLTPVLEESNNKILDMAINNYFEEISDISKEANLIPMYTKKELVKKYNNESFYKNFLGKRLEIIKSKMKTEFQNLLSNNIGNIDLD